MTTWRFTTDDGVSIAVHEWAPTAGSNGPPVVLQHGYIANAELNWKLTGVVDALVGDGRRVLALDARGHGDSDKPHDPTSYGESRMSADLMSMVDQIGVDEYDLVGYSMGGVIALVTATRDPRVRHLVVGGIGAGIIDFGGVDRRSFDRTALADALESGAVPPTGNIGLDGFLSFVDSVGGDRIALACQARAAHAEPIPLDRIASPTLVMVGAGDDLAVEPQRLADAIPGAQLKVVVGDHLSAIADPEFVPTLVAFAAAGEVAVTTFDEWRADASDLTSGGLRLAVHDHGPRDARVVTYLHGFPASSLDVVPVAERIGEERRILSLDFPGFGASEKPRGHPFSIDACADAVEDLWRAAGVTTSVLMSHDYGVSVGQELLSRRLDVDITGTVWSNGGLYPDLHRPTAGQKMLLDPDHGAEVAAAMDEELFRGGIAITWGQRRPMTDDEIHEMWESMAHDGGSAMANELLHYIADRRRNAERWRAALTNYEGAMCFVWGDLDPVSGAHMIERVEQEVPSADVRRMADVGHWPPLESPDEVAAAILGL